MVKNYSKLRSIISKLEIYQALLWYSLFYDTFHSSQKNLISYWSCRFTNFNISFEKHHSIFVNIRIYCFECPSRFRLQLQGEGTYQKKLDVKTFLFSSSNRGTQRCNGRKSHLSKLLSFVPNQRLPYKLVEDKYFTS